ncbi:MAG: monofunctional biosynthetic peptidoglycan transglycosylase [Hyphomicrobiales bacterium]
MSELETPVVTEVKSFGYVKWLKRLAILLFCLLALPYVLTLIYAVVPPPISTLQIIRLAEGQGLQKQWVPLDEISRHLPVAVMASEDARFCEHRGVDWNEVQIAVDKQAGRLRGASTIQMQTAKNLFLWPGRSYIRKALEVPLAYWIDFVWSKRRIIEVYLNIVEWGPGLYGAEAAARHHFKKPAKNLTRRQSALLAVSLPNPIQRTAGKPGPLTRKLARRLEKRMRFMGAYIKCLKE